MGREAGREAEPRTSDRLGLSAQDPKRSSPDVIPRRLKGLVDDLIAKALLLGGIYFLIGTLYQQAYLRYLGLRVGLFNIAGLLPVMTDFYVVLYAFALWAILTQVPDRWYHRILEVANPETWRSSADTCVFRVVSACAVWAVVVVANAVALRDTGFRLYRWYDVALPTAAFFSRSVTALLFLILFVCEMLAYRKYASIRRQGLNEARRRNRKALRVYHECGLASGLVTIVFAFGFVAPSWYGAYKAALDVRRMTGTPLMRVDKMVSRYEPCGFAPEAASDPFDSQPYEYEYETGKAELYFLGTILDNHLMVRFEPNTADKADSSNGFSPCLVSTDTVYSMSLCGPD